MTISPVVTVTSTEAIGGPPAVSMENSRGVIASGGMSGLPIVFPAASLNTIVAASPSVTVRLKYDSVMAGVSKVMVAVLSMAEMCHELMPSA